METRLDHRRSACSNFINKVRSRPDGHLGRSLYFSIVTFVTLGYGDISQTSSLLQLLSAIEAFCGMFLTGLFLAGFASKTKQY